MKIRAAARRGWFPKIDYADVRRFRNWQSAGLFKLSLQFAEPPDFPVQSANGPLGFHVVEVLGGNDYSFDEFAGLYKFAEDDGKRLVVHSFRAMGAKGVRSRAKPQGISV